MKTTAFSVSGLALPLSGAHPGFPFACGTACAALTAAVTAIGPVFHSSGFTLRRLLARTHVPGAPDAACAARARLISLIACRAAFALRPAAAALALPDAAAPVAGLPRAAVWVAGDASALAAAIAAALGGGRSIISGATLTICGRTHTPSAPVAGKGIAGSALGARAVATAALRTAAAAALTRAYTAGAPIAPGTGITVTGSGLGPFILTAAALPAVANARDGRSALVGGDTER